MIAIYSVPRLRTGRLCALIEIPVEIKFPRPSTSRVVVVELIPFDLLILSSGKFSTTNVSPILNVDLPPAF